MKPVIDSGRNDEMMESRGGLIMGVICIKAMIKFRELRPPPKEGLDREEERIQDSLGVTHREWSMDNGPSGRLRMDQTGRRTSKEKCEMQSNELPHRAPPKLGIGQSYFLEVLCASAGTSPRKWLPPQRVCTELLSVRVGSPKHQEPLN